MDVTLQNAAQAYGKAMSRAGMPGESSAGAIAPSGGGGGSFGDLVRQAGEQAVQAMERSEKVTLQSGTGQVELTDIVQAVTNAEVALQTVVAVRDRVIDAYQQIIRMPI